MHTDIARRTVNVALSDVETHSGGGQLLGLFDGKLRVIERRKGDATAHPSELLHGVSRMREGKRYSLIVFFA